MALSADDVAELYMNGIAVEGTRLQAGDADMDLILTSWTSCRCRLRRST